MTTRPSFRSHSRQSRLALRAPRIERLEDRIAPANNVVTSFLGGTLTITTVDLFDEASALAGDNNQNFQIIAAGPGNVTLHKNGATTIDGDVADVPFTGVVNIVIDVKEGDDFVVCKAGVNIPGDITFKGGDGNNTFNLDGDVAGTTRLRNLSITMGDGVDNIAFLEGDTIISGKVTINTGDGGSNMNIGFNQPDNVTIAGPLSITSGAGADNINFNGHDLRLKGAVSVKGGTGDNSVRFAYQNTAVLEKPITVLNGPGGDNVFDVSNTNQTISIAAIKITNSHGNNRVTFDSKAADSITGDITVLNGAGDNKFEVDSADFTVGGKVKVTNGAGNQITDVSPAGGNTVNGGFTLTNPAGNDTTTVAGTNVTYKSLTLFNGNGNSTTQLTGTNLSFGSISSTSGDGLDSFTVTATNQLEVGGGLTLKQGSGGSTTTIAATGAATAAIAGTLSITNGDGVDTQVIGNGAGNFSGLHNVTIVNGQGNSTTTFNPTQLTIAGSVSVTSGEGFDQFKLGDGILTTFNISGSVKVNRSIGGSNTILNPLTSGILSGAFTVTAGDDNDRVDVIRTLFGGAMTLTLGAGNDEIEIDNSTLQTLKFSTGAGNDIVEIELNTDDGVNTTILGTVTGDQGVGHDTLDWGLDANDFVTASQSVTLLGGLGIDVFDQNAATNAFVLPPTLVGIEIQLP